MKLQDIPFYSLKRPKYLTGDEKDYLLVVGALKKFANRKEAIKAKKEGLSEPRKKWMNAEIEACYFTNTRTPLTTS